MKTTPYVLTAVMALLCLACSDGAYEKGDTVYSYMQADFVEAYVGSDRQVDSVLTDDGDRLLLTEAYSASWMQRPDTVYRAVLYYNKVEGKAQVVNMQKLSTVSIRKAAAYAKGVKTDPLTLESVWLSGHRRFLNMSVIVKTGAIGEDAQIQTMGMVGDSIVADDSGRRICRLQLYHNQGDVPQYYSQRVYFSVVLDGLEADSLHLSVNTYDGMVTRDFSLSR